MMAFVLQSGRWFSNHLSPGPCEPKTCGQGKIGDPAVDGQRAKISPHNPEVLGSNPSPATIFQTPRNGRFWFKHAFFATILLFSSNARSGELISRSFGPFLI